MPKGGGRHAISQSKEDFGPENLHVHYCLCGEFILVVDAPLAQLPRRPFDGSYCLVNRSGPAYRTYKLNVSEHGKDLPPPRPLDKAEGDSLVVNAFGAAGKEGNGVLVNHDGGFEFQRRFFCPRCQLQVGYETKPGEGQRGDVTFILAGALSSVQNQVPADAFGEPTVTEPASAAVDAAERVVAAA